MDGNTKRFIVNQLMWLGVYFAISIAISIGAQMAGLPWPVSFGILIAVIIGLSMYRRRRYMRRIGMGQGSFFGRGQEESRGVQYYCMNCGTKHNKAACPNCGSKLKKAGF